MKRIRCWIGTSATTDKYRHEWCEKEWCGGGDKRWWQKCRHRKLAKINTLLWCECAKHHQLCNKSRFIWHSNAFSNVCYFCLMVFIHGHLDIWYSSLVYPCSQLGNFVGSVCFFLLLILFASFLSNKYQKSIGTCIWITSPVIIVIIIFIHINFDGIEVECAARIHSFTHSLTSFNKSLKGFINEVNVSICHSFLAFLDFVVFRLYT